MQCNKCGGDMWDNRRSKRNPKAPDFKCKDRDNCDGAVWLDKAKPAANGNSNGNSKSNGAATKAPPLLTPSQFIAGAAKVAVACDKMAKEAGLQDPEWARSLFIAAQRAGLIEVVGAKLVKPAPKPQPEPEPEPETLPPDDDEIPAGAFADGGDSGLDL